MATYFRKYYFEFRDTHSVNPAMWRVDILDSQGVAPNEPILIQAAGVPVVKERIDVSEDKSFAIIGSQLTISYEFRDQHPTDPLPDEFFDADEKRYKVELRKDGALDGVYYIKPDFCQYPDVHPPFTVQLKAVDGLSYAKGEPFNVYKEDGLLLYDKISLYEAIMSRALHLILEPGTKINVVNTLKPTNIESGVKQLFGTFIHTDMFFDFVEGAQTVHDVLMAFCKSYYARIMIEDGEVWFIRTQDLKSSSFVAEQYIDGDSVTDIPLTGFVRSVGPGASYDAIPVHVDGLNRMVPAIKRADFETEYKGINQLSNFEWAQWDGISFADWEVQPTFTLQVGRTGSGTPKDPYKLFIPYPQDPLATDIQQQIDIGPVHLGDVYDFEIRYRFSNVSSFRMSICVTNNNVGGVSFRLLPDGKWTYGNDLSGLFTISRSGKKREGTLKIKSEPIPVRVNGSAGDSFGPFGFRVEIFQPTGPISPKPEPSAPDGVEIYPIKLGIIAIPSKGRHLKITNNAQYSQVKELDKFTFVDTGEDGVSNTIFTGASKVPANGWVSETPGVPTQDIEKHMAAAHIDQYRKSITMWEGTLLSNTLKFYHLLEFSYKQGKRFMQISDTYDIKECEHNIVLAELMEEGSAEYSYTEWDIEEEKEEK